MNSRIIMDYLESLASSAFAEDWDNVGLLAGREDKEVGKILLALDATGRVIEEAASWGADMLITHHPLIFSGMKSVTTKDFIGRRVYELIRRDIVYYALHTNFDVMGMADEVAGRLALTERKVLAITYQDELSREGIGRVGSLPRRMALGDFAAYVKERCGLRGVRVYGSLTAPVSRVALVPGSGKGYIQEALAQGAEILLTGDVGHHDGLDAMEQGLFVIDAGHFGLEKFFAPYMQEALFREFPGLDIRAAAEEEPFCLL